MKLYYIGNKPNLYDDYVIYYFPAEKLLFIDDLIWINSVGQPNAAGKKQTSLYNTIKDLGISVDTIIQSYPARDNEYKTKITFKELEDTINSSLNKTH